MLCLLLLSARHAHPLQLPFRRRHWAALRCISRESDACALCPQRRLPPSFPGGVYRNHGSCGGRVHSPSCGRGGWWERPPHAPSPRQRGPLVTASWPTSVFALHSLYILHLVHQLSRLFTLGPQAIPPLGVWGPPPARHAACCRRRRRTRPPYSVTLPPPFLTCSNRLHRCSQCKSRARRPPSPRHHSNGQPHVALLRHLAAHAGRRPDRAGRTWSPDRGARGGRVPAEGSSRCLQAGAGGIRAGGGLARPAGTHPELPPPSPWPPQQDYNNPGAIFSKFEAYRLAWTAWCAGGGKCRRPCTPSCIDDPLTTCGPAHSP